MKCRLINTNFSENYGRNLLNERGIIDVDAYINPSLSDIIDYSFLKNIKEGIELVKTVLENKSRILIVVDCDCDGFTSAAIIYLYLKRLGKEFYNTEVSIDYILHEGKQHGLQDHIQTLLDQNITYGLVILPDSSSNDFEYHEQLKDIKVPCLVLDHHITDMPISSNAIVINNQLSEEYPNKELTGAGVTYQFCRALDQEYDVNFAFEYIDLAALGIIGDMGGLLEQENRAIIYYGLKNIKNFFFHTICDKQSYSMGDKITPITVAFYVVPLINAMIRVGSMAEKTRLFEAFIDGTKKIESQKRGAKGQLELLAVESVRECTNARTRQNKIKETVVDSLTSKIMKNGLLDNKILFIQLEDEDIFPSELNGLVAMQLSQRHKRPTIVARLNDEGFIRGSARGLNESSLKSFKAFLDNMNLFEYTAGHDNAFGISIANTRVSALLEFANISLSEYDFGENYYDVSFQRKAVDKDIADLIKDLSKYNDLWGQANNEPLIHVCDINITEKDIKVMGKNNDTVKFEKNGITYIQFHAKQLIEDLKQYPDMQLEIVGRPNLNEWGGMVTPQIFIEAYEIRDGRLAF